MKTQIGIFLGIATATVLVFAVGHLGSASNLPDDFLILGGVPRTHEYQSTTTSSHLALADMVVLKSGPGSLGSIVHTAKGSGGDILIYNATTSNIKARTGQLATTTLLLAALPQAADTGTYVYDVDAPHGILVIFTGTKGTTTITYR
jgi:hypothetical protein